MLLNEYFRFQYSEISCWCCVPLLGKGFLQLFPVLGYIWPVWTFELLSMITEYLPVMKKNIISQIVTPPGWRASYTNCANVVSTQERVSPSVIQLSSELLILPAMSTFAGIGSVSPTSWSLSPPPNSDR